MARKFKSKMKLQDIFRKSDFDKVFDHIIKIDPKSRGSKFSYMTAFEYLCDMKAQSGYQIEFKDSTYENAPDIKIACAELNGYPWKMAIGGEVIVSRDTPNDIIAAVALYNLTFYGFSPDERRSQLKKWYGKPTDGEPQEEDLLTDETKALQPDPIELDDDEYDRQYDIYGEAVLKNLRELAQNGDKYGQFYLGRAYDQGLYGLKRDKDEAFRLYQESAAQGYFKAQNNLAQCYEHGSGTAQDPAKAKELYAEASKAPNTLGFPEENLAFLELADGNKEQAIDWFQKAASKGDVVCKQYVWYLQKEPNWTKGV